MMTSDGQLLALLPHPQVMAGGISLYHRLLRIDFEDHIEFDWNPERKARNADDRPDRSFLDAKDIPKQIRGSVRDPGMVVKIPKGRKEHSKTHDASHSIERAQMLFCNSEDVQSRSVGRISSGFDIEFLPEPANMLRLMVHKRKYAAKKEQVTRLHCLDVSAQWCRSGRELYAKALQPAISAARL
jgi:hypothetical protein